MRIPLAPVIALLLGIACDSPPRVGDVSSNAPAVSPDVAVRDSAPHAAGDTLWLFAAEPAGDAVHADDTEATLRARYGADNVAAGRIHLGEGETALGTVLFPNDSSRRLTIMWKDTVGRTQPTRVTVDGRPTRWYVIPGVSLGTSLSALEQLNGKPFKLFGFAWDYAGTVSGWEGGRLDSLWRGGPRNNVLVWLRLSPDSAGYASAQSREVAGERIFSSSLRAMRALNPRVYALFIEPR